VKPFTIEPRYIEIYFEPSDTFPADEAWAGFGARIQSNPTGAEVHHARRLWREAVDKETTNRADAAQAFWSYVAPRIVEWNYSRRLPDGTVKTYPPPAEDPTVMNEIDESQIHVWLGLAVLTAHQPEGLGKLIEAVKASPSDASTTASTPPTKLRPKNSSKPSVSTLRA
jgi:hypothetical protein